MSAVVDTSTTTGSATGVLRGIGVGRGCAIAPVAVVTPPPALPADEPAAQDPEQAVTRLAAVLTEVAHDLRTRATATAN
ncbi:MAG TPA: phosphoenolpyruvate-utilizing N-terminal domain-containing protein, partial [Cellulomonas sp.]